MLREGDRGPGVLEFQLLLAFVGYSPGPFDGIFGWQTRNAYCRWMHRLGTPIPGVNVVVPDDMLDALRVAPRRAVEVNPVATPATWEELRPALVASYLRVVDDVDRALNTSEVAARVAGAMLAEEHWDPDTQRFGKLYLFCVGNPHVRAQPPDVPHFWLNQREVIGGADTMRLSPHAAAANFAEGCDRYWATLREFYPHVLPAFEAGEPERAAEALKGLVRVGKGKASRLEPIIDAVTGKPVAAYFTGSLEDYREAMRDRFEGFT